MLMVRMGHYLRMVRSVIVAEDTLVLTHVCVGIVHTHRIAQFSADNLIDIQTRAVPEENATPKQAIVVIGGQADNRLLNGTNLDVLSNPRSTAAK
jgi:hypothetical protein